MKNYRIVDLFAGIGGIRLGFDLASELRARDFGISKQRKGVYSRIQG